MEKEITDRDNVILKFQLKGNLQRYKRSKHGISYRFTKQRPIDHRDRVITLRNYRLN